VNALEGVPLWTRNAWNALHQWNVVGVGQAPNQIVVKVVKLQRKDGRRCVRCVGVDPKVVNDVKALEIGHV